MKGFWKSISRIVDGFPLTSRVESLPQKFVRVDVEIGPLLGTSLPKHSNVRLIPDLPIQTLESPIRLQIRHKSVNEIVVISPISIVARPDCGRIATIRTPDIMRKKYEPGTIFTASPVV